MENKPVKYAGRFQLRYRGTECLNCGHPLDISDRYCPNCSQANSTKKLTLKDFIEEFFSSVIDYDSRLLKSVSAMILKPGRITLDYVQGKRVSYTNPFRFLLSLAIIYFLLLSLSGDFSNLDRLNLDQQADEAPEILKELDDVKNLEGNISNPEGKKALAILDSIQQVDSLGLTKRIAQSARRRDSLLMVNPKGYYDSKVDETDGYLERVANKADAFMNLMRHDSLYTLEDATSRYGIAETRENRLSFNIARSLRRSMKQPADFIQDLIERLPFATFFFLPIFAVFVWLVYIRKNFTYTDNLVFCFHNQSLFFILLIVNFLVDSIFKTDTAGIFLVVFAFYLYKSMRNFYRQGRFKTILKYLFLNTVFVILATVTAVMLLLGSAFTY